MKKYDVSGAKDFLELELEMTPAELLEEVRGAMCRSTDEDTFSTLLSVADLLERIVEAG